MKCHTYAGVLTIHEHHKRLLLSADVHIYYFYYK